MATRRYGISLGQTEFQVVEAVGSATAANNIELTVDIGATFTDSNAPGGTRAIKKEEVIQALEMIINHLVSNNFPPA